MSAQSVFKISNLRAHHAVIFAIAELSCITVAYITNSNVFHAVAPCIPAYIVVDDTCAAAVFTFLILLFDKGIYVIFGYSYIIMYLQTAVLLTHADAMHSAKP